jgi:hypothetical protein
MHGKERFGGSYGMHGKERFGGSYGMHGGMHGKAHAERFGMHGEMQVNESFGGGYGMPGIREPYEAHEKHEGFACGMHEKK